MRTFLLGLAISVIGNLFVIAASTAVAGLHLTNWRSILLGTNILGGLCGGSGTTLMSAFAYVADTHPEEGRAGKNARRTTFPKCAQETDRGTEHTSPVSPRGLHSARFLYFNADMFFILMTSSFLGQRVHSS